MIGGVMIGQLAANTGLSVRTVRFYADAGVLPETGRTQAGYGSSGPRPSPGLGWFARCASLAWG